MLISQYSSLRKYLRAPSCLNDFTHIPTSASLQITDCATVTSTSIAIAGVRTHAAYQSKKVGGGVAACAGCSVWLLGCAPLCAALASGSLMSSPDLVSKTQVWESAPAPLSVPDHDPRSNDLRLVPVRGLNLLAACFPTGVIHLLNTHGINFTIRSTFSRHTQNVHALALCELESLIISGGVSR